MTEFPSPANDTLTTGSEQEVTPPSQFSWKWVLIPVATLIVGLLAGTAFTAAGVTEFLIGDRYTAKELKIAKETSREDGYEDGQTDGYEDGQTDGYEAGQTDGYEDGQTDGYSMGYSSTETMSVATISIAKGAASGVSDSLAMLSHCRRRLS